MKVPSFVCLLSCIGVFACNSYIAPLLDAEHPRYVHRIEPYPQQLGGNPQKGFQYLTQGSYIGAGIPIQVLEKQMGSYTDTVLKREGLNQNLHYSDIAFTSQSGAQVVSGSCFSCHANSFQGKIQFGLGDSQSDFQKSLRTKWRLLHFITARKVGKKSPEWETFSRYDNLMKRSFQHIVTQNPGVNPAFRLEEAYFMHRNPKDLRYSPQAQFSIHPLNIASDVPPLWNVKKKNALYYNGMGRGDFTKLLMQASSQGIKDSTAAREVQRNFIDVLAWINSLKAPTYPSKINASLAAQGRDIFDTACKKCHGSYGKIPSYPNKIVPMYEIQTDPVYAQYFLEASNLAAWYNKSWYATSPPRSEHKPSNGYIAPPLDGAWATAPYLHNGSIPTLEALLDSKLRPTYWENLHTYDTTTIGWRYVEHTSGKGNKCMTQLFLAMETKDIILAIN